MCSSDLDRTARKHSEDTALHFEFVLVFVARFDHFGIELQDPLQRSTELEQWDRVPECA